MKIDQKLLRIMGMAAGIIIIFIVIIALISSCTKNKKYTLDELENRLVQLSKDYYNKNKSSLPSEGENTSLTTSYFISNGNFKELILTTGETCSGEVVVTNNNGYYLYTPKLNCGSDIKPIYFADKLTEENNVVSEGEGLYNQDSTYIFRGESVNNYLEFNDQVWRIIKVNSDNTIRIIESKRTTTSSWDNRYNIDKKSNIGINDFISNNINSRIKNKLESLFEDDKLFDEDTKAYFAKQDLCIGKRSENDTINDGTIECSEIIKDQIFGLIQVNEYFQASLDENCPNLSIRSCTNYNYLAKLDSNTWTITTDKDSTYKAYKLDYGISLSNASSTSGISIVAHLSNNVLYKQGNGSFSDPYILK